MLSKKSRRTRFPMLTTTQDFSFGASEDENQVYHSSVCRMTSLLHGSDDHVIGEINSIRN